MTRFLAEVAFALLAWVPTMAMAAFPVCDSNDVAVQNYPASPLLVAPGTVAGTALGGVFTITVTSKNCTGGGFGPATFQWIPLGTDVTPSVNGVTSQLVGTPSFTSSFTSGGSCGGATLSQASLQTSIATTSSMSHCTVTFTASGQYTLGSARIVGAELLKAPNAYYPQTFGSGPPGAYYPGGSATGSGAHDLTVYVPACAGVLSSTQTVQLPKISTSAVRFNSDPAGKTGFQITLMSCTNTASNGEAGNAGYSAHLSWAFSRYSSTSIIQNTGTASNVGVVILKSDAATAVTTTADDVYALTDGNNIFQYYAAYAAYNPATLTPGPGSVSATATFTVTYQ